MVTLILGALTGTGRYVTARLLLEGPDRVEGSVRGWSQT